MKLFLKRKFTSFRFHFAIFFQCQPSSIMISTWQILNGAMLWNNLKTFGKPLSRKLFVLEEKFTICFRSAIDF